MDDIIAALRARCPLLWVVTKEEPRAERYIAQAANAAAYVCRTWDIAQGAAEYPSGKPMNLTQTNDAGELLGVILSKSRQTLSGDNADRNVWIMRDLPVWLEGMPGASVMRAVRNIALARPRMNQNVAQAIIVISPSGKVPDELSGHATVIDWPLPDKLEIAALLDATIASNINKLPSLADDLTNGKREAAIDAALGLSEEETAAAYSTSLVKLRTIDALAVAKEKKRVIAKERVMEWHDPIPGGLSSVGGLENLKTWLLTIADAWSEKARKYGLKPRKGCLLVGVPGCGKSLTAKAIATALGIPLIRLDLGALKSKFVGESEQNIRKAFRVIEAIGRCVVWLDEIEKALAGATDGSADGGVSTDALGSVLTWMQERQGEAFVIATANDVSKLPPELMRKGRFDEVFFVDLPTVAERKSILQASLRTNGRSADSLDLDRVAASCFRDSFTFGFTGSEVSELVPTAMYAAYADGVRDITTADLLKAASETVPLSKTASEKISNLRQWAVGKARPATAAESEKTLELTGVEL
jgi:ATP-dependent 26S proteasome regulatory subunit